MSTTVNGATSPTNTANTANGSQATSSNDSLGKDDFLKLLVTQMQNQDPMNPTDDTQSIAEMAQFSALEQMTNISTSMDTLNTNMTHFMQQTTLSQGAALIGKAVSGVDTDGTTPIEGTVEAVKWLDSDPQLQILKVDGTTVDMGMNQITLVQDQTPVTSSTDTTGNVSAPDAGTTAGAT